jgi:hypothetical protein
MNRKELQALLPVLTAFAEGRPIQCRGKGQARWMDFQCEIATFDNELMEWRVKPNPAREFWIRWAGKPEDEATADPTREGWRICSEAYLEQGAFKVREV